MIKVAIVGASGYAGAELVRLLSAHQDVKLTHLFVSANSADANRRIADLYGNLEHVCDLTLEPLSYDDAVTLTNEDADVVFMATDHKVSHDLSPIFLDNSMVVIDLSGAFRLSYPAVFAKYYGFEMESKQKALLDERIYALVDHVKREDLQLSRLISMPGCYTTCAELALKPLVDANLLDHSMPIVIDAVSGVSGAGRKASLTNSFCEVSLNAYGQFKHRHLPEIEQCLGTKVIFTPHLANFKRGILATCTARLNKGITKSDIDHVYKHAYTHNHLDANVNNKRPLEELGCLVRFKEGTVKVQDVANTPFCDISYTTDGEYIIITSALDNLLKGAASQAIEAMNIHFGLPRARSLL